MLCFEQVSLAVPEVGMEALDLTNETPPCDVTTDTVKFNRIDRLLAMPLDDSAYEEVEVIRCKVKRSRRKKRKPRSGTPSTCSNDTTSCRSEEAQLLQEDSQTSLVNGACASSTPNDLTLDSDLPVKPKTPPPSQEAILQPQPSHTDSSNTPTKERTCSDDSGNASQVSTEQPTPCDVAPKHESIYTRYADRTEQKLYALLDNAHKPDLEGSQLSNTSTIVADSCHENTTQESSATVAQKTDDSADGAVKPKGSYGTPIIPPFDPMELFRLLDSPPKRPPPPKEEELYEIDERLAKEHDYGFRFHSWDLQ